MVENTTEENPIEWSRSKLHSITTKIGSGATPRGGRSSYKESGISLIRSQNVFDLRFEYSGLAHIDEEQAEGLSNVRAHRQDVLLNITGASVARCCQVPDDVLPARVNQHVAIIRPDPELADPTFVCCSLVSPTNKKRLLYLAQGGATREALTKVTIEDFDIYAPSLRTQRRISSILSAYSDLIARNQRRIKILEEMARAIYREWFVHFRFPGNEAVERVNSELGEIPEGWRVKPFTEMVEVLSGGTPRTHKSEYWNGSIPFFTPRDIKDGFYILDTERHITKLGLDRCRSENFPKETVFITARGTVGRVVMPAAPMAMSQTSYALRGRNGIEQSFVFYKTLECVEQLKKMTHGAVFDTIITDTFRMLKINSPPLKLVKSFCTIISPLLDLILSLIKQNSALQKTRDILLPKLVSGQVDVSGLKIEIPADTLTTHKPSYQSTLDN